MAEKTLQERLRIKAGIMEMGNKIAWGSDTILMHEAADRIDSILNIVQSAHDRLLRGDNDNEILSILESAFSGSRNCEGN